MLFHHKEHFRELSTGIGIIFFARLCMALVVLLSRFAVQTLSMPEVIFFQNFIALLCLLPFFFKYGVRSLKVKQGWHVAVRVLCGFLAFVVLLIAAQIVPMTDAILLNNAAPLYVPFVVLIWLKVPINHRLWGGIILGFIGLILVLQPWRAALSGVGNHVLLGLFFGFLSGLFLSVGMVAMRILRFSAMFPILFYYYLFGSVVTLPTALSNWSMPTGITILYLIAMGALTLITAGGYLMAFKYGKASHLSPFFYVAVIYGALFDWIFFHHFPDTWMVIGTLLLIAGGIWVILKSPEKSAN